MTTRSKKITSPAHPAIATWWNRAPLDIANQPSAFWDGLLQPAYFDSPPHSPIIMPRAPTALTAGLPSLDGAMGALGPSDFICIASRPSMGSTALALQFAIAASEANTDVLFLSLDLAGPEILLRYVAVKTGISKRRLDQGRLTDDDKEALNKIRINGTRSFIIDDNPRSGPWHELSISSQVAQVLDRLPDCSLVVIDGLATTFADRTCHLRGSHPPEKKRKKQYKQNLDFVDECLHDIHSLARSRQCAFVVTLPLSRAAERRYDHRPRQKDLAAFARASYWCDFTLLLYRPEVYWYPEQSILTRAEISVYRRDHFTGNTVPLRFDHDCIRFKESLKN